MRSQRALPFIGCGSLGLLALLIGGCSSNSAKPDGGSTDAPVTEVHADTGNSDVKDSAPDRTDTGSDRGPSTPDIGPADHVDTNGSICTGVAPTASLIADFDGVNNAAFGTFGADPLVGGTYVNLTSSLTEDFSNQNWHLVGTVFGHQDFFGLYWNCTAAASGGCTMDASQFSGIQFDIKGNVGPSHTLNFTLGRAENDTATANAMCGSCVAPADASSTESACRGPRIVLNVPLTTSATDAGTATTVTLHWADLSGGVPNASVDPHQLTGILWFFTDPPAADGGTATDAGSTDAGDASTDGPRPGAPSYDTDFFIDNVRFLPL
jgi:hypothetical protein